MFNTLLLLDASVWGTVSDWTSIAVNVGAALLIYKTLKSQVAIQKLQEKVTAIEHAEFIKSIEPKFDLDIQVGSPVLDSEAGHYLAFNVKCFVNLMNNPAKNVKFNCVWPWVNGSDGVPTNTEVNEEREFLNYGDYFLIGLNVRVADFRNIQSYFFTIKILLDYSDTEGNKYTQSITVHVSNDGLKKIIRNPILS